MDVTSEAGSCAKEPGPDSEMQPCRSGNAVIEVLANMSHDLRAPLNAIIGFAEFISDEKSGPLNSDQKEYLADVLSCGRALLQLVTDVSQLVKMEAGKMELFPQIISLQEALSAACAQAALHAAEANVELRFE